MTLRFGKFTEEEMIIQSLLYVCLLHGKMKKHHQHLQFVKSMNLYINADVVINFNKQNEKKKMNWDLLLPPMSFCGPMMEEPNLVHSRGNFQLLGCVPLITLVLRDYS
jgi:hypothetical protein